MEMDLGVNLSLHTIPRNGDSVGSLIRIVWPASSACLEGALHERRKGGGLVLMNVSGLFILFVEVSFVDVIFEL